jgi:uncharacterized protein (DUF58 family)
LKTRKTVNATAQGAYHSRFKGRGMAFSESRSYAHGDDPRHVDWNATARTGDLHVKQFVEERELTLLLAVDLSGSMGVGSHARIKRTIAAEAAALLAFSALRNNDKVGLVAFSDEVELLVRPKKGRGHVLRLLREILAVRPARTGTNLPRAIETVTHLSNKRAIVAVVTDLIGVGTATSPLGALEKPLKVLAGRHDLMLLEVEDALERALPDVGLLSVVDPESGRTVLLDTGDARVRDAYAARVLKERTRLRTHIDKLGVDRITLTEDAPERVLTRFLLRRARRLG